MKVCRSCRRYVSGGSERCPIDGKELEEGPLPPFAPGDEIGSYVVKRALAAGDTGVLLLCAPREEVAKSDEGEEKEARKETTEVLIKVIAPSEGAALEDRQALFESVAKLPESVKGLRPIEEVFIHEGRLCFVQSYLEGVTLAIWLRLQGVLEEEEALALGKRLCETLEAIHDAGLMHGDVRPGHIFIPEGSQPREGLLFDTSLPSPAQRLAPPELHDGQPDSKKTDVYGLCVTLYAALTGRSPFRADSADELSWLVHSAPPPPLRVLRSGPEVSPSFERLVMWGMSKNPEDRPPLSKVAEILDALSREDEEAVTRSFPPVPSAPPSTPLLNPEDSSTPTEKVQIGAKSVSGDDDGPTLRMVNKLLPAGILKSTGLTEAFFRDGRMLEREAQQEALERRENIAAWLRLITLLLIALILGGLTVWSLTR